MTKQDKIIPGIHHITAITGDAQKNVDFYCGVLGLRLVKLTVNFDDPGSYHLYYGDGFGRPGTILTFFAWAGAYRGHVGPPQVTVTAFAVPAPAIDFWVKRLVDHSITTSADIERFGQRVLSFADPDGLKLELVGVAEAKGEPWPSGLVPVAQAIRGFHSATIAEEGHENTARLLTDVMGFEPAGSDHNRFRYRAAPGSGGAAGAGGAGDGLASTIDLLCVPDARHGSMGAGVVHHIAFRTADDAQQEAWRKEIAGLGYNISPVMDRCYFHSIYYREPGGVLFEIATDTPGFTADEPAEQLGSKLMLPPWLETQRAQIERVVPPLRLPGLPS